MERKSKRKKGLLIWAENNPQTLVLIAIAAIFILPFVLSQPAFCRFFELYKGDGVGSAIGGITAPVVGIISILLLYLTLKSQKDSEYRTSLENRIFQMVDLHRKNVETMHSELNKLDGQDVFKMISSQISECVKDITPFLSSAKVEDVMNESFRETLENKFKNVDLLSYARIDIAYTVVYIGFRDPSMNALYSILSKRYKEEFFKPLLGFLSMRPVDKLKQMKNDWEKLRLNETVETKLAIADKRNLSDGYYQTKYSFLSTEPYDKLYWGHHLRLGHYFRHLYSVVDYIDSQERISKDEKYEYVKLIRTQLSNTEQMILMANSLSYMGRTWEFFRKESKRTPLITTYKLIKNIPEEEVYGFKYRTVYKRQDYEN